MGRPRVHAVESCDHEGTKETAAATPAQLTDDDGMNERNCEPGFHPIIYIWPVITQKTS